MTNEVLVFLEIDQAFDPTELTEGLTQAITMSLNRTADRNRTRYDKTIREQIAFPPSYLAPRSGRLIVGARASHKTGNLYASIIAQDRPTSLARFATGNKVDSAGRTKEGGLRVQVDPNKSPSLIKRAFFLKPKGQTDASGAEKRLLAVRTDGGKPSGAYKPRKINDNLWLLFGPSVTQALVDAGGKDGIVEDMRSETLETFRAELARNRKRLGV